jgi:NAD(P)H dehydrogenase (quinone)
MRAVNILSCVVLAILISFSSLVIAQPTVLITYHSETGNTKKMADYVERGARSVEGVRVVVKTIQETTEEDLLGASAIILGSPVFNANVAPEVMDFMRNWPFEGAPLKDKLGAAFVTSGGMSAGEELTMVNLLHSMMVFGMITVGGDTWTSAFGASAITAEPPFVAGVTNEVFLNKAEGLGRRVATLSKKMQ